MTLINDLKSNLISKLGRPDRFTKIKSTVNDKLCIDMIQI